MKTFGGIKFDAEIVLDYKMEASTYKAALLESGILRDDPIITNQMSEQGNKFTAPSFVPLTGRSQNHDGSDITTSTMTSKEQSGIVIRRDNAWSSTDLESELASADPMKAIGGYLGDYWKEDHSATLFLVLKGAFSSVSVAAKLVDDIAIEDGTAATDANKMNATTMIAAQYGKMGDAADKIARMTVHTDEYSNFVKANLITHFPVRDQGITIPKYFEKFVLFSDNMPKVAGGTSGFKYTSVFFSRGAIGKATGKVKVPLETERKATVAGGTDVLVSRDAVVMHPYGLSFNADVATSPSDTQLETGTNWTLVYDHKNVGLMAMVTNG